MDSVFKVSVQDGRNSHKAIVKVLFSEILGNKEERLFFYRMEVSGGLTLLMKPVHIQKSQT